MQLALMTYRVYRPLYLPPILPSASVRRKSSGGRVLYTTEAITTPPPAAAAVPPLRVFERVDVVV